MLFSELYKIMVNKVNFVGFRPERGPLVSVEDPLANTQKKLRSDLESLMWMTLAKPKSPENLRKTQKQQHTENQKNTKTEK